MVFLFIIILYHLTEFFIIKQYLYRSLLYLNILFIPTLFWIVKLHSIHSQLTKVFKHCLAYTFVHANFYKLHCLWFSIPFLIDFSFPYYVFQDLFWFLTHDSFLQSRYEHVSVDIIKLLFIFHWKYICHAHACECVCVWVCVYMLAVFLVLVLLFYLFILYT